MCPQASINPEQGIKKQFDAIVAKHLLELHRQHLWHRRQTTSSGLELLSAGIGPMYAGYHGFDKQMFGADEPEAALCSYRW
jgi:hypothetical protein